MNPYHNFVSTFANLIQMGKSLPLGGLVPPSRPKLQPEAPQALIFSPHPDDECIIGGLALRWLRESGTAIGNVAVTLGSNRERQQPRLQELRHACNWLGLDLVTTGPNGLEKINPTTRANNPAHWQAAVDVIAALLIKHRPRAIFLPHELDWNSTHVGTHFLVMDALKMTPADFRTILVETEFWGQMPSPNLMVESSVEDVADLLAALSFHVGEVSRNPYHLRMPAWLQDNVRRGAELVGGQGGHAPDFAFATLYRLRQWKDGEVRDVYGGGKLISAAEKSGDLFDLVPS
jgi:LmbE family N-acetylglucosaminyl deacetylase